MAVKKSAADWAKWLREGGGSWSWTELAGIVLNRGSEAADFTFRMEPPYPIALRKAAQERLRGAVSRGVHMFGVDSMTDEALNLRL